MLVFSGIGITLIVLGLTVFPTRSLLSQRREKNQAEQRLYLLRKRSSELAGRAKALREPSEIERLAREQYNLVRPGEEAYALLPSTDSSLPSVSSSTTTSTVSSTSTTKSH